MHIQKVLIRNILGVKNFEFDAGKFNAILGPNGTGKTSVLRAIRQTLGCGHDATLLRKGEAEGEVVLVLDDGRSIRRRVTAAGTKTDVIEDGKRVAQPVQIVQSLTDMLSVNPVAFLKADEKERAKVLLQSMPLTVDCERLTKISGIQVKPPAPGVHALDVITAVAKQVYDDRTGTNRAQKEKDATINQLKAAMPSAPADGDVDIHALRSQMELTISSYSSENKRINDKLAILRGERDSAISKLKQEAQERIAAIQAELAESVEAVRQKHQTDVEERAAAQLNAVERQHSATYNEIKAKINAAEANHENVVKRRQAEALIANLSDEFAELGEDAQKQTKALADIEAYKMEMLSKLPIPGLSVVDGVVMRDGIPFDSLNTSQQVQIAVEIAKLRAGELGVICVDGIEALDSKTFEMFRAQALASDLQMFVTRVDDEDFGIEADPFTTT